VSRTLLAPLIDYLIVWTNTLPRYTILLAQFSLGLVRVDVTMRQMPDDDITILVLKTRGTGDHVYACHLALDGIVLVPMLV
jgi:hypothetical protein